MTLSIPVLYYHRVGAPDPIHLSVPTDVFERQMNFLAKRGVKTVSCSRLIRHMNGEAPLHEPSVVITFDDGFRDNMMNAAPILARYRFSATVFSISSMIRPTGQPPTPDPRPFNEAHTAARRGDFGDFLSASELKEMAGSGVFEIHSHSHAHNQVFTSPELTGFFPDTDNHWGILSAYGDGLKERSWPVFKRGPGLLHPALKPNIAQIRKHPFRPGSLEPLPAETLSTFFATESKEEYESRILQDLRISRDFFLNLHEGQQEVLCWPWGASNLESQAAAERAGYAGAVLTATGANVPGSSPFAIKRFPVKKASLFQFALGYWLRTRPTLARLYGLFHGKI